MEVENNDDSAEYYLLGSADFIRSFETSVNQYVMETLMKMEAEKDKGYPMAVDALGNTMEIGAVYGYSQSNSGVINVTVGILEELVRDGARYKAKLRVLEKRAGYGHRMSDSYVSKKYSYTKTGGLFKLSDYQIPKNYE